MKTECWAFKNKETFQQHAIGTVKVLERNFLHQVVPILSKRLNASVEDVEKAVRIASGFHDIGKTSIYYQLEASNYYGHEIFSGYIVWRLINDLKIGNDKLASISAIAALSHHEAMGDRKKNELLIPSNERYYEFYHGCEKDIDEVAKYLNINPQKTLDLLRELEKLSLSKAVNELKGAFNEDYIHYVILVGPLMIADTITANQNRKGNAMNNLISEYKKFLKF
ncbi:hypothetical protein SUSAZ_10250 [Sulfolobus acidocaldarius SUSAZ]|nr:hypothetical protein SUSAZ_10250 [Sulfolobus acidocaldarius SUSAZ]